MCSIFQVPQLSDSVQLYINTKSKQDLLTRKKKRGGIANMVSECKGICKCREQLLS